MYRRAPYLVELRGELGVVDPWLVRLSFSILQPDPGCFLLAPLAVLSLASAQWPEFQSHRYYTYTY